MKTVFYKQCTLSKKDGTTQVSWIPEKFALLNKVLKLKENEKWDDGWIVKKVGDFRKSEEQLPDSHKDIKHHRKNTGDSLPKEKP